jgi:pimeloyl-ACP methyl ester carboxylesterase
MKTRPFFAQRAQPARGSKLDGPVVPEISHKQVKANDGRGNLAMNNWNESIRSPETPMTPLSAPEFLEATKSKRTAKAWAAALAVLMLAIGTTAAATTPTPQWHAVPCEKGAQWLMHRPEPDRLPDETNNPVLGVLAKNYEDLKIDLRHYPTSRSNRVVNIAFHIIEAPGKPVLAFIHGLLADYIMWEYVAAALVGGYEVWLVDLPGCGESDAPKPSALEPDDYSPTAMGERVWQALRKCLADKGDSRQITLVGHSLGGTVVTRMLGAPELRVRYAAELGRIDRAVLFAPCNVAINAIPPSFLTLLGLKGGIVTLGEILGAFDAKIRDLTRRNFQNPDYATIQRMKRYAHALSDGRHREAAKAMLREFAPYDPKTLRPIWRETDRLVADYRNISVPVLIVHGAWDETLSCDMGHALKDRIPGAMLIEVTGYGHSLPTEAPTRCATLIERFQQKQTLSELAAGIGTPFGPAAPVAEYQNPLVPVRTEPSPEHTTSSPSL